MSFIQRELDRINSLLGDGSNPHYAELYAAQQALAWALEPTGYKAPLDAVMKDTLADSEDYSVHTRPPSSLNTYDRCERPR